MDKQYDNIILGKNAVFTTNMQNSQINNNVLVIAASGAGKTYSVVQPCLLETNNSSVILSDPKGILQKHYTEYFKKKGYKVIILDLDDLSNSMWGYDPIEFVDSEMDVLSLSHTIIYADSKSISSNMDPYWNQSAEIFLSALMMLAISTKEKNESYFGKMLDYACNIDTADDGYITCLFYEMEKKFGDCLGCRQWKKICTLSKAERTWSSVKSSMDAALGRYESTEFREFLKKPSFNIEQIVEGKTAVFIKCSDSDSTLYNYINIFYSQVINLLFRYADKQQDGKLPIPVRLILDDFCSNTVIEGIGRILSTCRSRDMALTLIVQAESQMQKIYHEDAKTIYGNCDSIVFLGTNDLQTAKSFSERLNLPLEETLYMPIGKEYIIRRGSKPIETVRYDLRGHKDYSKVYSDFQIKESNENNKDEEVRK